MISALIHDVFMCFVKRCAVKAATHIGKLVAN